MKDLIVAAFGRKPLSEKTKKKKERGVLPRRRYANGAKRRRNPAAV